MSKEKWYEEEHQKDAAMVDDLLAKSQFADEYQSRDAIEAEYVARKAILDRFESLRKPAGRERGKEGAGGLDPELVRMGCAYLSALNLIGQLRKLAVSDPRYWDHFCGCVFCKSHIDRGHVEGCLLVESQKALLRYDDERRSGSASSSPQRAASDKN